jgi:hypothetical protein
VALRQELEAVLAAFRVPIPRTPRAADAAWIAAQPGRRPEALEGIMATAVDVIVELIRVADEHARAIQVLLEASEILPIPSMTLVRSIHDALLTVCWAADSDLDSEQRISRFAALTLGSIQDNHRTVMQVPNPPPKTLADAQAGMIGMQTYLKEHGFTLRFNDATPPYALNVTYGAATTSLKINMTAASNRYMPAVHHMWPVASGATHSRNWFTAGLEGSRDQLSIMAVAPLLDFCDAFIDVMAGYVGLDPATFHRRAHIRRRALLMRAEGWDPAQHAAGYDDYARQ